MCGTACGGNACVNGVCACGACSPGQTRVCGYTGSEVCTTQCRWGSCSDREVLVSNQAYPWAIAVDTKNVYWTNLGTQATGFPDGAIMTAAMGGLGIASSPMVLATGQYAPQFLAVDGTYAYWTSPKHDPNAAQGTGLVTKVPANGGAMTTLASQQNRPYGVAVQGAYLYWANRGYATGDGAIMMVPVSGGTATAIASGLTNPYSVAVDSKYVYWTTCDATGLVARVSLSDGTQETLATGEDYPCSIAVDDINVYWANNSNGGSNGSLLTGSIRGYVLDSGETFTIADSLANPWGVFAAGHWGSEVYEPIVWWAERGTSNGKFLDGLVHGLDLEVPDEFGYAPFSYLTQDISGEPNPANVVWGGFGANLSCLMWTTTLDGSIRGSCGLSF
jgi:hypothetical protein